MNHWVIVTTIKYILTSMYNHEVKIKKTKLDWNNMLINETAIECWNILTYEIESIINTFVPLKNQGKRSRKKNLSKEAIRKIVFKQNMCTVYRRTRRDEDYAYYQEALNAATTEIRQSENKIWQYRTVNYNSRNGC